ncbi:MAG TPA: hypothetical protein VKC61_07900 [Pyrinomonadaceae bacterium]|nr:hypothetical protein [Pyrinomonadaceae bacterium]
MALKSKTVFREIRRVFIFSEMNALIARLAVLYEDLRIETFGIIAESLAELDYTDEKYRKNYFMRRSVATLVEVAEAFRMLDEDPDFQRVKDNFDEKHLIRWKRSLRFFKRFEPILRRVRNDIGGHFGHEAARYAIKNINLSTCGKIELSNEGPSRVGVKLHFAGEIATYALVRHRGAVSDDVYAKYLIRIIALGYKQAIRSIDTINAFYLWNRFVG